MCGCEAATTSAHVLCGVLYAAAFSGNSCDVARERTHQAVKPEARPSTSLRECGPATSKLAAEGGSRETPERVGELGSSRYPANLCSGGKRPGHLKGETDVVKLAAERGVMVIPRGVGELGSWRYRANSREPGRQAVNQQAETDVATIFGSADMGSSRWLASAMRRAIREIQELAVGTSDGS
jgi:hypothetical protein